MTLESKSNLRISRSHLTWEKELHHLDLARLPFALDIAQELVDADFLQAIMYTPSKLGFVRCGLLVV